jgi:hypothetical protein
MKEAVVKLNWKHSAWALALLISTGGYLAEAKPIETGPSQLDNKICKGPGCPAQDGTPVAPPTNNGIKDKGIAGCGSCGLTSGRQAAPGGGQGAASAATTHRAAIE